VSACIWSWTKSASPPPQWNRNAKKYVLRRCVQSIWNRYCKCFASGKNTLDWCVGMNVILNQICKAFPQWMGWKCEEICFVKVCAKYLKLLLQVFCKWKKHTRLMCYHALDLEPNLEGLPTMNGLEMRRNMFVWRCAKYFKFVNASALQVQKTH
jgi:hypothetical protein